MSDAYLESLIFQDREDDLEIICSQEDWSIVLNVVGEAGIGKTRLLKAVVQRLERDSHDYFVMYLDLGSCNGNPTNPSSYPA